MELDRIVMKKLMLLIAFAVLLLVGAQRYRCHQNCPGTYPPGAGALFCHWGGRGSSSCW